MMAVTPRAPAPTEEIDTSSPSTAPRSTVSPAVRRRLNSPTWAANNARILCRKISTAAVAARAPLSIVVINPCAAPL
jgi:hypothetical protein